MNAVRGKTGGEGRKVLGLSLTNSGFTNTYTMHLLFSLKKRKFVKPALKGDLKFHYLVYEGVYLYFVAYGKYGEPMTILCGLARVVEDGYWKGEGTVVWLKKCTIYARKEEVGKVSNELIRDVISARPGYHRYPPIDFDKVYDERTVNEVLELINQERDVYFIEVEE